MKETKLYCDLCGKCSDDFNVYERDIDVPGKYFNIDVCEDCAEYIRNAVSIILGDVEHKKCVNCRFSSIEQDFSNNTLTYRCDKDLDPITSTCCKHWRPMNIIDDSNMLREGIDYWKEQFDWMKKDRDRCHSLLKKLLSNIEHTCDNCTGRHCITEKTCSGGCNWEWNGWYE